MNNPKAYEEYSKMSMPELCEAMADFGISESKANIARLIYEERQMAKQHEYEMSQIEFQHDKNIELLKAELAKQEKMINAQIKSQSKWMKFSVIITAISTLSAAIAGALVAHMLHTSEPKIKPQTDIQQNIQRQIEPSPVGLPAVATPKLPEKEEIKQKLKK